MSFLDFVEQDDAVGPAAHRFGQHAAFAVADIARWRAFERGDGVRFLEFAHVDGDEIVLAAVERFGQGERGFGFADAAGTGEHEHADRLARDYQAGARGLNAPRR